MDRMDGRQTGYVIDSTCWIQCNSRRCDTIFSLRERYGQKSRMTSGDRWKEIKDEPIGRRHTQFPFFLIFGSFRSGKKYFYCLRTSLSLSLVRKHVIKLMPIDDPSSFALLNSKKTTKFLSVLSLWSRNSMRSERKCKISMHRTELLTLSLVSSRSYVLYLKTE